MNTCYIMACGTHLRLEGAGWQKRYGVIPLDIDIDNIIDDDDDDDDDVDFELDFDLDDFTTSIMEEESPTRILKPRIDTNAIRHHVTFSNAEEFADAIDLQPGARTFAWLNGNFVFGDILEALAMKRNVLPKRIYISTLSISQENIDSLHNIVTHTPGFEKLYMLVSGYFYSHEKFGLVPYLYDQLDVGNKTQIAFGNYHGKIMAVETQVGNTFVLHGSANMRSSNSIEQIMFECNDDELFQFNADIIGELCDRFGTIDHSVIKVPGKVKTWRVVAESSNDGTAGEEPAKRQGAKAIIPAR